MVGYKHQGRLVTHIERKSRLLLAGKAPDDTAISFNQVSLNLVKVIPVTLKFFKLDDKPFGAVLLA